ncbi:Asp-tRNA(Asn)/Glu-tRNA(Gln) amidotransferase subunit GatA [archaeon]|nr:MAG: Asp-tRNA(Asn)/Glu-tRNA(Gln) amidotransferase subunit GatA [archaeon]
MDEFGMGSATSFSHHGATYNPYSPAWVARDSFQDAAHVGAALTAHGLTPGGSSGGAAVAVATGAVLGALGSDTGGSCRLPAAYCGVVGFKPSYGRISRSGLIAYASSCDTIGVLASSVADAALLYDIMAGEDAADDTCLRLPRASTAHIAQQIESAVSAGTGAYAPAHADSRSLRGVRVGLPIEYESSFAPDSVVAATWRRGAALLRACGAEVVRVSLPNLTAAVPCYYVIASAEASSNLSRYDGVRFGHRAASAAAAADSGDASHTDSASSAAALHELYARSRSEGFGPEVQRRILLGTHALSAAARGALYNAATATRRVITRDLDAVFRRAPTTCDMLERLPADSAAAASVRLGALASCLGSADAATGVDVLLSPVAPTLPWRSADTACMPAMDVYVHDLLTLPASLARCPSIAVPVEHVAAAQHAGAQLPVGLQLTGRYLDEASLLHIAGVLESAAGFTRDAAVIPCA